MYTHCRRSSLQSLRCARASVCLDFYQPPALTFQNLFFVSGDERALGAETVGSLPRVLSGTDFSDFCVRVTVLGDFSEFVC
jgi:hypothetical protein